MQKYSELSVQTFSVDNKVQTKLNKLIYSVRGAKRDNAAEHQLWYIHTQQAQQKEEINMHYIITSTLQELQQMIPPRVQKIYYTTIHVNFVSMFYIVEWEHPIAAAANLVFICFWFF